MPRGLMFAVIVVGSAASATSARADDRGDHDDDRFEASAYFGIAYYGDNTQLGNSWAPEQVPGTAPTLGGRVLGIAVPDLGAIGRARLQLAVEGEVGVATAFTGGTYDGGRMQYFAPVFDWRAHVMLRAVSLPYVRPHLLVGAGGETIASRSPFMAKETDPEVYWGVGTTVAFGDRWMMRVDGRHGLMPGRNGLEQTLEIQLGLGATFGLPRSVRRERVVVTDPAPVQPVVDDVADKDGDGIPDIIDACPDVKETVNGVEDGDGCPDEAAPLIDPKRDRDNDGIADVIDKCPDQPETVNGIDDDDGCPDTVPDTVLIAIASAQSIVFEPGRARLNDSAKEALGGLATMLTEHGDSEITITVHAERPGTASADLAKRRADAIKWALVDQGVVADRLSMPPGAVRPHPDRVPLVEITLVITPHPATSSPTPTP